MREGSGRNRALNDAAHSLGTMAGWIDLNEVAAALYRASVENGYVAKDGAPAAHQTITSGIEAGRKKPRKLLTEWTDEELAEEESWLRPLIGAAKRKLLSPLPVAPKGKRTVTLLQGASIVEKPITWLWDGYLPSGKLTLLAGAGGTGKSTIAFSLAATITNGGVWPDGKRCNGAGNVLIWSSEDDPADTIKPRLMAVNANAHRYGIISGTTDEAGLPDSFDAARDMDGLRDAVSSIGGISLLIIDPIISAVTGDMHKANDVRRSLQAIVDFAAECNCAVLGITHFAKGTAGRNSAERVIGSQAFAALARMVLVAAKEEESDRRVFTRAKSNNSVDTGGYSYSIEALTLNQGIVATRVVWGEALEGSSRSILAEVEGEAASEDTSKIGQVTAFLREALAHQAVGSKELFKAAFERFNVSEKTVRRAGARLGIKPQANPAYQGGWSWSLPQSAS
jgi:putative DNA primase/helicase